MDPALPVGMGIVAVALILQVALVFGSRWMIERIHRRGTAPRTPRRNPRV